MKTSKVLSCFAGALFVLLANVSYAQRGLWVWTTTTVVPSATERHRLVNACVDNNITDIYLYMDRSYYTSKESQVKLLIAEMTCAGVKVWGLEGYRGYFSDIGGPQEMYNNVTAMIAYNSRVAANERFVGLHSDMEPQDGQGVGSNTFHNGLGDSGLSTTAGSGVWKSTQADDREYLMRDWVNMHKVMQGMLHGAGLKMGAAVTSWPDDYFGSEVSCTFDGIHQGVYKHLMNYIDDYVVMSYSTSVPNLENRVIGELNYADTLPAATRPKVYASLETHPGAGGSPTSYGDHSTKNNKPAVLADMATVISHFSSHPSFAGMSIHDWYGWQIMTPTSSDTSDRGFCSSSGGSAVTGIAIVGAAATNATSVDFTIFFSAPMQGVTASNLSLSPTLTGATIGTVTATGVSPSATWNVNVSTGSQEGALGLNFVNGTGVTQADSTPLDTTNLPFNGADYTIDRTPPTVSFTTSPGQIGGTIAGTYSASDGGAGSGVASLRLYARQAPNNWADAGPLSGNAFSYTPSGSGNSADGLYYFDTVAIDAAGNSSNTPSGNASTGVAAVAYNNATNTPMTHQVVSGTNPAFVFPLNPNLNVWITFTGAAIAGSGAITIERKTSDFSAATSAGLNENKLMTQYWTIDTTGGFTFGTATLAFAYNETLFGSELTNEMDINRVYAIDGGVLRTFSSPGAMSIDTSTNKITVTGVDHFSSWFAGNSGASSVTDWAVLLY
ncbi:hypothetical protein BH09SUM1_BH09SUM1_03450 [soil metagenome]